MNKKENPNISKAKQLITKAKLDLLFFNETATLLHLQTLLKTKWFEIPNHTPFFNIAEYRASKAIRELDFGDSTQKESIDDLAVGLKLLNILTVAIMEKYPNISFNLNLKEKYNGTNGKDILLNTQVFNTNKQEYSPFSRDSRIEAFVGIGLHEIYHVVKTDFAQAVTVFGSQSVEYSNNLVKYLANCLEDNRIEGHLFSDFSGTVPYVQKALQYQSYVENSPEKWDSLSEKEVLIVMLYALLRNPDYLTGFLATEQGIAICLKYGYVLKAVHSAIKEIAGSEQPFNITSASTQNCIDCATTIEAILRLAFNDDNKKDNDEDDNDEDDNDEEDNDEEEELSTTISKVVDTLSEKTREGQNTKTKTIVNLELVDVSGYLKDILEGDTTMESIPQMETAEFKAELKEVAQSLSKQMGRNISTNSTKNKVGKVFWSKPKPFTTSEKVVEFQKILKAIPKTEIKKLSHEALLFNSSSVTDSWALTGAKIDGVKLAGIPAGNLEIFTTRKTIQNKPIDIVLLIDESGSMAGSCIEFAKHASIGIAYALNENTSVNVYIYGHTSNDKEDSNCCEITCYLDKGSKTSHKLKPIQKLHGLTNMKSHSNNRDGSAILAVAERIDKCNNFKSSTEKVSKLMLVISDGLPSAYANNLEGIAHTRAAVQHVEKNKGWTVLHIPVEKEVEKYSPLMFNNYLHFTEPKNLLGVLCNFLRKKFKKLNRLR